MVEVILNGAWDSISSSEELYRMCGDLSLSPALSKPEFENPSASPMLVEDDEEDLLGPNSPNPSLVITIEEGEASALLDTSIDKPEVTSSNPPPSTTFKDSDLRDRMTAEQRAARTRELQEKEEARKARKKEARDKEEEEARKARRKAKKAEKKKKAKKAKQEQKAMLPQGTDWAKEKESDEAAKSKPSSESSTSIPSVPPPTPAPKSLAPYTIPKVASAPSLGSSSKTETSKRRNIPRLMDEVIEHPYSHPTLLESSSPQANSGPPPCTTQRTSRPPRTTSTSSGNKRDRSGSSSGQSLSRNDLRHNIYTSNKRPKFVEPDPKPSPLRSKNPSALLVLGQRIPKLIRNNLPASFCEVKEAVGEIKTSHLTLANELNTFLLQHPSHQSLVILADFPWWSMCLDDRAAYIKMMADATKNICARSHNHLSFRSCKLVCLNLYQDRASEGLTDCNLPWSREEFDKTKNLLESLNDPANQDKIAFPSLQTIYDKNKMEELFDPGNTPSPTFISSIRNFVGNLVHGHFGTLS